MRAAIRAWLHCPADRRPSPRALGQRVAEIAATLEGARLSERELDPKDVLADLFEEMLLDDPQQVAQTVIDRLKDSGFQITPIDYPKRGA